jgi:hypothetical protein
MAKVKQDLQAKSHIGKADYGDNVINKLTGNANFPSVNPSLDTLKTVSSNLRQTHNEVEEARKTLQEKQNNLNAASTEFDTHFTNLGLHIENVSNGDEAKIHSTGMEVQKTKARIGVPSKVVYLNATSGDNAGEIDIQWDSVKGAASYIVQAAINDGVAVVWTHITVVTKSKAALAMKSGVNYQIRVAAVGSAGQGPWSDSINKVAP